MAAEVNILIKATDQASGVLGKVAGGLSNILSIAGKAALAGGAALGTIIAQATIAAGRVEELKIVNQVLAKNAGLAGEAVSQEAQEVRGMGIEAAIAQEVVAKFIKSNLNLAQASDLARVAQDAAVISGQNSTDTLNQIINGITTLQPEMIRTAGLTISLEQEYKKWAETNDRTVESLTQEEKQMIALNATLEQGKKVVGAYEAAMTSASKQIRSFPRYINDIMVAIGEPFQATFQNAAAAVGGFLKELGKAFGEGGQLRPMVEGLAKGLETVMRALGGEFTANQMLGAAGDFWVNFTSALKQHAADVDWGEVSSSIIDGINSIDWATHSAALAEGAKNLVGAISTAIQDVWNETDWSGLFEATSHASADIIAGLFGQDEEGAKRIIRDTVAGWKLDFQAAVTDIGTVFEEIRNSISTKLNEIGLAFANFKQTGLGQFISGFLSLPTTIISIFVNMINSVRAVLSTLSAVMRSAGTDIAGKMADGIRAAAAKVIAEVKKILDKIKSLISATTFNFNFGVTSGGSAGAGGQAPKLPSSGGGSSGGNQNNRRAAGGPVDPYGIYTVGERGPETLVMGGRGGTIIPNGGLGGSININISSFLSLADMDNAEAKLRPIIERAIRNAQGVI